jgi:2-amino-4-hydroxy-6-hydroxymethyldihydropteridine diphosphokinase
MTALSYLYAVAIGSNQAGAGAATPRAAVVAALALLDESPLTLLDASRIDDTAPIGPSQRRYANGAALVASRLLPDAMMAHLHAIEARLGRRRARRWGQRRIDLDLILWSEGSFAAGDLIVPHPAFRDRGFVLDALVALAPEWQDPVSGYSVRQLHARLHRRKPVDRSGPPH